MSPQSFLTVALLLFFSFAARYKIQCRCPKIAAFAPFHVVRCLCEEGERERGGGGGGLTVDGGKKRRDLEGGGDEVVGAVDGKDSRQMVEALIASNKTPHLHPNQINRPKDIGTLSDQT